MKLHRLFGLTMVLAALGIQAPAHAQSETFPSKAVTIVVPTPAAGPLDAFARVLSPELAKRWDKPVVVRNQAGAGTALGTQAVARAKPDGHTLLVANIAISAHGALSKAPLFDIEKDLQPITLIASTPFFLFVPGNGHQSLDTLVDAAKKAPNALNFAIIPNSQQHLDTVQVLKAAGIEATLIPYQGTAPIIIALLSNEVDAYLGSLGGVQGHLDEGRIRGLATTSAEPSKHRPEIPSFKSLGVDIDMEPWYALFAPAGLSPELLTTLRTSILDIMAQPEIIERIETAGYDPRTSTAEELAKMATDNLQLSRQIVREANIEPQ